MLVSARADECVASTGLVLARIASQNVGSETCETSTIDAEAVHLLHDLRAERREAVDVAVVARRAADVVAVDPGQRHVADAARRERAQVIELRGVVARQQRVTTLEAVERAHHARLRVGAHVGGAARHAQPLRVVLRQLVDRVDLPRRLREELVRLEAHRQHEDREELRVEPAGRRLREIHLRVGLRLRDVDAVVRDELGRVGVRVDDDRALVDRVVGRRGRGGGRRGGSRGDEESPDGAARMPPYTPPRRATKTAQ